jgi:hypothetical protein
LLRFLPRHVLLCQPTTRCGDADDHGAKARALAFSSLRTIVRSAKQQDRPSSRNTPARTTLARGHPKDGSDDGQEITPKSSKEQSELCAPLERLAIWLRHTNRYSLLFYKSFQIVR